MYTPLNQITRAGSPCIKADGDPMPTPLTRRNSGGQGNAVASSRDAAPAGLLTRTRAKSDPLQSGAAMTLAPRNGLLSSAPEHMSDRRLQRLSLSTNAPSQTMETVARVVVGAGSAAAYFMNASLGGCESQAADAVHSTLLIGKNDAWAPCGRGKGVVNHQAELIAQWCDEVPPHNKSFDSRARIISDNKFQMDRAAQSGATLIDENVVRVERCVEGAYQVTTESGVSVRTAELLLATGLGPHTCLLEPKDTMARMQLNNIQLFDKNKIEDKVFDVDQFMRASDKNPMAFEGKTVVIHGANAGWDAVERAGELGIDVIWMVRNTTPAFFDGTQLKHAPSIAAAGFLKVERLEIRPDAFGRLEMVWDTLPEEGRQSTSGTLNADHYVYAFGQDVDAPLGARSVLGPLTEELRPVYDHNQVYTDRPWETVLALETRDSRVGQGVKVIGAAVSALAPFVPHSYVEDEMDRLKAHAIEAGLSSQAAQALCAEVSTSLSIHESEEDTIGRLTASSDRQVADLIRQHTGNLFQATRHIGASKNVSKEVLNQVKPTTASIVVQAQFGAIRGSIAALQSHIPGYIQHGKANFSTDDRTMLMVYAAHAFPDVSPRFAERFIDATLCIRRMAERELRSAITDHLLADSAEHAARGGHPATYLATLGLSAQAGLQAALSAAEDPFGEVAHALELEDIPSTGMPETVRSRYEGVLEHMLSDEDGHPDWNLLQAWLKR